MKKSSSNFSWSAKLSASHALRRAEGLLNRGATLDQRTEMVDGFDVKGLEEAELAGIVMVPGLQLFIQEFPGNLAVGRRSRVALSVEKRSGCQGGSSHKKLRREVEFP
jgi:hypothetical protein